MKVDPWHIEKGFTIIPRTSENNALNFLDCPAEAYLNELKNELRLKNIGFDKPIAFLLNPPYKNTDENIKARESTSSEYEIHSCILELIGTDAGKERYLAFLGQILNISEIQAKEHTELHPVVMIFTPTSWLIPRPTYTGFRKIWDRHFKIHSGFIITSNAWFKLDGKWPLAFTIWTYNYNEPGNNNKVKVADLTHLEKTQLNLSWNAGDEVLKNEMKIIQAGAKEVVLDNSRGFIKDTLPYIFKKGDFIRQTRFDYSVAKKENEYGLIVSGFPLKNKENHFKLNRKCGGTSGNYIGFMDDSTSVRVRQDSLVRMSNLPDRVWFRLDTDFKELIKQKFSMALPTIAAIARTI